nr:beta-3-deoxy-D-manno-oct-2-ulosonic acid transferase [uncultured Cohaesibacter sp.]
MAGQIKLWQDRPAVIYGVGFWNRGSIRGMLAHLPGKPRFFWSFHRAIKAAKASGASLFAWTSRLSDEQRSACEEMGVPIINVEDGFIRSVGLGAAFVPAASLIMDEVGIYYDPSQPSDLELMLESAVVTDEERARGKAFREQVVALRVSKYNIGAQSRPIGFETDRLKILVPGQVSDDASIRKSRSDSLDLASGENPNLLLLKQVRQTNPDAYIIFKPHPDVSNGLRLGNLTEAQTRIYADAVNSDADIIQLIEQCDVVETISSLSGFEALLRGKRVVVHGLPFYAGWGVSEDRTRCSRRNRLRTLDELVFLAMICYPQYVELDSLRRCEAEDAISGLFRLRNNKRESCRDRVMLYLARVAFRLGL